MQCARVAFGFAGIHDEDEADDIVRSSQPQASVANRVRDALKRRPEPVETMPVDEVIDMEAPTTTKPLAAYLGDMATATEQEAINLLDRARTDIASDEQYEELVSAYRARFTPENEGNGN